MGVIFGVLAVVVFCVFPVMLTARKLGAGKSDLIDCIIAIVVQAFVLSIVIPLLPGATASEVLAYIYSFLLAGVVYKFMLQASYIASVLIAIISTAITYVALYIFASIFAA